MLVNSPTETYSKSAQVGFTLIELMIAVAIIAILASVALPSYRQMMANTQIRGAAESIQNGLQQARIEAIKRNARVKFELSTASNGGWVVGCLVAVTGCPSIITERKNKDGSSNKIKIDRYRNATLDNSTYTLVVFDGMGSVLPAAGVSPTIPAAFTRIDVDIDTSVIPAADSRELRVNLNAGGGVRTCDPNGPSTDPRSC